MFWIAELFIWLLILFLVSGGLMFAKYNYKKNFNTYQIFLPDVDGLINGSPVRMLGIQIGYVNQVDIVGEDVYVKFIVTQKGIKLPHGSIATVEFSGLGGSKSLEIYPPEKNQKIPSDKFLIAQSPRRIHDSLGLLNEMFDKVSSIAYKVSYFMDEVGIIKAAEKIKKSPEEKSGADFLDSSINWINGAKQQCDDFNKKMDKKGHNQNDSQIIEDEQCKQKQK